MLIFHSHLFIVIKDTNLFLFKSYQFKFLYKYSSILFIFLLPFICLLWPFFHANDFLYMSTDLGSQVISIKIKGNNAN